MRVTSQGILAGNPQSVKRFRLHPPPPDSVSYGPHNTRVLNTRITLTVRLEARSARLQTIPVQRVVHLLHSSETQRLSVTSQQG